MRSTMRSWAASAAAYLATFEASPAGCPLWCSQAALRVMRVAGSVWRRAGDVADDLELDHSSTAPIGDDVGDVAAQLAHPVGVAKIHNNS